MWNKIFAGVVLILLTLPVTTKAQDAERAVVVLFGDSITVGENVSSYLAECPAAGGARPGLGLGRGDFCTPDKELIKVLANNNRVAFVLNHGAGGTASGGGSGNNGVSRLSANLTQSANQVSGNSYFVLILYGTNDQGYGLNRFDTQANIEAMIGIARARGYTPVIGSLLPRSTGDSASDNVTLRNTLLRQSATSLGATFVDQYSNFVVNGGNSLHDPEVSRFSGNTLFLHPKKIGYQIIAQHWFDAGLVDLIPAVKDPVVIAPLIYLLTED